MIKSICKICTIIFLLSACKSNKTETMTTNTNDANSMYMLVGTYTSGESKGIYVYKLDTITGTSEFVSEIDVDNPSYLTLSENGQYMYSVSENGDLENAVVNAFSFDKQNGQLTFLNKVPTNGADPCHLIIDNSGKHIITANYSGGSITIFDIEENGHLSNRTQTIQFEGEGIDPKRQTQPHLHFIQETPDGKYIFANDLGTDQIHKFETTSNDSSFLTKGTPPSFKVKNESGPRHTAFHPSGKYAYTITELSGDVIVFDYNDGILTEKQTIKVDTLNAKGSGDIHVSPDGKFVYASNRLQGDGIAIFSINEQDGTLTKVGYQLTGIHPRNFAITPNGQLLLVATRDSNLIQVFKRDMKSGLLEDTGNNINLSMPVCIKFTSIDN